MVKKKGALRTGIVLLLGTVLVVSAGMSSLFGEKRTEVNIDTKKQAKVPVADDRIYITSTKYNLVPGVTENVLTTNNESGTNQRIGFLMDVTPETYTQGQVKIVACYKDYQYEKLGLQTVTDQAKAYEAAHPGEKVIAGINADFYNMNTGAPSGAFVMDGTVYNGVHGRPYFAVLKDGTAVIRDGSSSDLSDVREAVAGNMMIITNGEVTVEPGEYQTLSYSRTAVGIKEDGTVMTYVTHGISAPTSCGETYVDVAKVLAAQGCISALMLDGGGSATYASWREGTEGLKVQNNPSDGTPRTVSNTLLFVSTVSSDGVFNHASITPNNTHYTPSTVMNPTKIQFEAAGIDASGTTCALPTEGLVWTLADDSKHMGTLDSQTGEFKAATGKLGVVNVNLQYNSETVGSTSIELSEPDELYFNTTALSLDFNESTDLGLNVKGNGVDLHIKDGDFKWTIKSTTENAKDELLGTVENNIFTAGSKQEFALEGTVSASYRKSDGTELTAEISVEVGKMPVVKRDFEDSATNVRGQDVVGLWDWGANASYFKDTSENQQYTFQNYETLYYLQSTTYGSDSLWINEVYETEQPWKENDNGTVTCTYKGKEYIGTKTGTYGVDGEKWVEFTDENGSGYYWRGLIQKSGFGGNFNAGRSASAILAADGYDMYVWHTSANPSSVSKPHGEGSKIVDANDGEVRFGNSALKLTYDFTNFSPTGSSKNCNTYYRMAQPLVADGSPTGLGMWVYAPEDMANFWFWTQVTYWNGTKWTDAYIHFRPSGAEQTCQYTGINWTGWSYVEADLSSVYAAGAVVDAQHPIQIRSGNPLILLTYIPGGTNDGYGHAIVCGSKSAGYFYIDNVRFVYGTNVDDMDNPEIISAKANESMLSAEETTSLSTNDIIFTVDFTDPQGENHSGIDETATQLYLDGTLLGTSDFAASADRAQTIPMKLANGEHTLKVSICDNFGNHAVQNYSFVIDNPDSVIPTVSIEREERAELGGDYKFTIKANRMDDIASISTSITYGNVDKLETVKKTLQNSKFYDDYGNELTLGDDGQYYDAEGNLVVEPMRPNATTKYSISSAVQVLGENLTGTVRNKMASSTVRQFKAEAVVAENPTKDTNLLTFTLPIPSILGEDVKVPYNVTVTYTTKDGNTYSVTSGDVEAEIYAYYTIEPGVQVTGAENGILTIYTADKSPVDMTTAKVYSDTEEISGTLSENTFMTDYFVKNNGGVEFDKVYIADTVNRHYSFRTVVSVANVVGEKEHLHYDLTLNATTGDSSSTENITWFASTDAQNVAKVQYVTKEVYEMATSENAAFADAAVAEGTSKLTRFGADNIAVYVNHVGLSGLSAGTIYVYRAGDGTNWSQPAEFSTMDDSGSTSFLVVGDTQLSGDISSEADQRAIAYLENIGTSTSGVNFGIQTGDFVDGGINYLMWDEILQIWGEKFAGKDFVHVMGNHENYGTDGSRISSGIFGLESSERDYYSVEYGNVYVAVINQTADLNAAAQWLVEDAAKTNCTWKVLTCHQPAYYSNPNGSSEGHNKILAPACDQAGIDFMFSGHDHSYVRTEQMLGGVPVDYKKDETTNAYVEKDGTLAATQGMGTVYYICGDLGEKSRGSEYAIVDNPDFHFASTSQDYDALYLTVEATKNKMTVNTWNMTDAGSSKLIDTYTMYSGSGVCAVTGEHSLPIDEVKYNSETQKLICNRCGEEVENSDYTGYALDKNGADEYGDEKYYFLAGKVRTDFFTLGEEIWYANETGLIDHATENKNTNTCTENGNRTAYSPRYEKNYTGGKVPFTGHDYEAKEDGTEVCKICQHEAIDIADWNFKLSFTSTNYSGGSKTPGIVIENPETGEKLEYATDGMGRLTDYTRIWSNNKNVGTAKVTIKANPKGDYTNSKGDVELTLRINPDLPKNVQVHNVEKTSAVISWTPSKQADGYKVYQYKSNKWSLIGTTAETSYVAEGLNSGATYDFAVRAYKQVDDVTYTSVGYTDAVTVTTPVGIDINDWTIKLSFTKTSYNGNNKRPAATVTDAKGNRMVRGKDYTIEYKDNQNAGTATVTVKGIGGYSGTKETTFSIAQQNLDGAKVEAADVVFEGGPTNTNVTVTDKNGRVMAEGVDYTLKFAENDCVGIADVVVTGIGNYTGTVVGNYNITACDIAGFSVKIADGADLVYTGNVIEPLVEVSGLEAEKDYTVSYIDNVEVGKAKVILTGIGDYTGTQEVEFEILARNIENFVITDGSTYSYTGEEIEADLNVLSDLGTVLVKDEDYLITEYRNNVNKGIATVVIEGIGKYQGTAEHEFEILGASVETFTIELEPDSYSYGGVDREPNVTVKNGQNVELTQNVDYTISYSDNRNAGTAMVEVTGIGNYNGVIIRNFTIEPVDISTASVTLEYTEVQFSGGAKTPAVTVKTKKGTTLAKNKNYTVAYKNNKNAGTAEVVVTGIGNYAGEQILNFNIVPSPLESCKAELKDKENYYTGAEITPRVAVKTAKGTTLKNGVNYIVEYKDNTQVGTAGLMIKGTGNYTGTIELSFEIKESIDLSGYTAELSFTKCNYTGNEKKPSVKITASDGSVLKKDSDYLVSYVNNTEIGKATVLVEGIGKYTGTITKTFTIRPPQPVNLKVASITSSSVKVTFERNPAVEKYYIYVDGKYTGCAKTVNYYTIKNLSSKKSYTVTIKAVKMIDGENYYSVASQSLKVTTK